MVVSLSSDLSSIWFGTNIILQFSWPTSESPSFQKPNKQTLAVLSPSLPLEQMMSRPIPLSGFPALGMCESKYQSSLVRRKDSSRRASYLALACWHLCVLLCLARPEPIEVMPTGRKLKRSQGSLSKACRRLHSCGQYMLLSSAKQQPGSSTSQYEVGYPEAQVNKVQPEDKRFGPLRCQRVDAVSSTKR
jgi:hypothetical protein